MIRLDKYLANVGVGTRTEVKKMIRQGRVMVNGESAKSPEMKIQDGSVSVSLDGREIRTERFVYYMLNKPAGCISATEDAREKTVMEFLPKERPKGMFPVGRLDKDTEGLLLLTNDGDLAHRLLSPVKHVDKVYYARVQGIVTERDVEQFAEGISIGQGEVARPAKLEILRDCEESEILVTIQEGKFHQVKRMFQSIGKPVLYLKRLSMGSLVLDESLAPGQVRPLTDEELKKLC